MNIQIVRQERSVYLLKMESELKPTSIEFDKVVEWNGILISFEEMNDLECKTGDRVRVIVKKK